MGITQIVTTISSVLLEEPTPRIKALSAEDFAAKAQIHEEVGLPRKLR